MKKFRDTVRELTASDQVSKEAGTVEPAVNAVIRGYWNYYSLGTSSLLRWQLNQYVWERMRIWVLRKHTKPRKRKGIHRSRGKP